MAHILFYTLIPAGRLSLTSQTQWQLSRSPCELVMTLTL